MLCFCIVAIEVLQETNHIRNKVKRSRRNSKDNDNCSGRTRRSFRNRFVHGVRCCKKFLRKRQWPSKCNRYLKNFRNIVNSEYSDA